MRNLSNFGGYERRQDDVNLSTGASSNGLPICKSPVVHPCEFIAKRTLVILCLILNLKLPQVALAINSVLDINGTFPYLIDNMTHQIIEPCNYMDFDNIYTPNVTYKLQQTAQGRNYHLLKAFDFANYFQSDYWHYSDRNDLLRSAEPVANAALCSQHLDWLEQQLNRSAEVLFHPGEQHINLMTLVDSFGHPETATYYGHGYWLGSYYECKRVSIDLDQYDHESCHATNRHNKLADVVSSPECDISQQDSTTGEHSFKQQLNKQEGSKNSNDKILKFRYCIGKAHDIDWPSREQDTYTPRISYKVGLCLPETCETLSFERHAKQIERLMRLNLPSYTQNRISLHDIYCVPDDRSPIRRLPLSARLFLTLCISWLAMLVLATCTYSCYKRHQRDLHDILAEDQQQKQLAEKQRPLLDGSAMISAHPKHNLHHQSCPYLTRPLVAATGATQSDGLSPTLMAREAQLEPALANGVEIERCSTNNNGHSNNNNNYNVSSGTIRTNNNNNLASPKLLLRVKTSDDVERDRNCEETEALKQPDFGGRSSLPLVGLNHEPGGGGDNNLLPPTSVARQPQQARSCGNVSHFSKTSAAGRLSPSATTWISDSPMVVKVLQALSIKETLREFQQPPKLLEAPNANRELRVNLNALDSIKCLCCILIIFGHIIFIHMQHLSNIVHTIELSHDIYPRALIAFFNFVDTFFIISGMLTAYFIFKRFNKRTFSSPTVWFYISLLRLMRLSPVYILVLWFIKTTSVYISHGPIWDYGTDKNSIKGLCINDHWWKSILYFGNFGTMQPICILPAWSIIVDAQYSLVLPLIIFMIFKYKRAGYLVLLVAIVVSTAKMTLQLANQTAVKTTDMAKIRLHVYPLISRFAAEFYNTAWNRIGPVAIGIFGGHMLYLYEIGKIRQWPKLMQGGAFKLVLMLHVIIFLLPAIGRFIDDPESTSETDTTIFILSNATIKPVWSIINTIFLLRLITDLRTHSVLARLMSHNIWHCLGKLCFTSYLIHYEIILILLKSRQEGLIDPNWSNAFREFSAVFLISTVISYVIYILYEAPMNKLIMLAFASKSHKLRAKEQHQSQPKAAAYSRACQRETVTPQLRS